MPKTRARRRASRSSGLSGGVIVFPVVLILLVLIFQFASNSPGLFLLIVGTPVVALVAFWFWSREQRKRQMILQEERRLSFAQGIGNLLALTPREFELTIGSLLKAYGYQQVRHTGHSGDLAADLHALSPQGEYVVVQCKRYAPGQRIGTPELQKFIGMITVHHGAQRGIFVTTCTFTKPAKELAQNHQIELIDGEQLVAMFARIQGVRGLQQIPDQGIGSSYQA
jgi:restriction system protein